MNRKKFLRDIRKLRKEEERRGNDFIPMIENGCLLCQNGDGDGDKLVRWFGLFFPDQFPKKTIAYVLCKDHMPGDKEDPEVTRRCENIILETLEARASAH